MVHFPVYPRRTYGNGSRVAQDTLEPVNTTAGAQSLSNYRLTLGT